MDFFALTQAYYSAWIGRENVIADSPADIIFVESDERNKIQYGYSDPMDLWLFKGHDCTIVSYGMKVRPKLEVLQAALHPGMTIGDIASQLETILGKAPHHGIKYVYTETKPQPSRAKVLSAADADLYLEFTNTLYPGPADEEEVLWTLQYFRDMSSNGYCCGVIEDGILVSCTDAPGMPYMADHMQEIGINTLPDYRQKGYAADSCRLAIAQILQSGKCPIWSTGIKNLPSQKLAEAIGFRVFGETLTLTL